MRTHVPIVAWLNIVFGGMALIGAVIYIVFGLGVAALLQTSEMQSELSHEGISPEAAGAIAAGIGLVVAMIIVLFALPQVLAGIGLLKKRGWGRILAIVVAILQLPGLPFGTALGVYGLVVLFNQDTMQMFEEEKRRREAAVPGLL